MTADDRTELRNENRTDGPEETYFFRKTNTIIPTQNSSHNELLTDSAVNQKLGSLLKLFFHLSFTGIDLNLVDNFLFQLCRRSVFIS